MSVVCIYHSADMDGLFSGAVVKHFCPDAHMIGWDYGDPVPEIPEDCTYLYIVDLSIPELMDHPRLKWIDHHKSAIERYPNRTGVRMDGVAACRLAWQWFTLEELHKGFPTLEDFRDRKVDEPYVLTLVGEYDVWDHHDPLAELLNYRLDASNLDIGAARRLLDWPCEGIEATAREGKFIQASIQNRDRRAHRYIHVVAFQGLTFACLNGRGNSLAFEGAELEGVDALMLWRHDGDKVRVSLYHRPGHEDLDLSEIAVAYGGGGHKGACGFEESLDNWALILRGTDA